MGRAPAAAGQDVSERLLAAAKSELAHSSHIDMSARKIAAVAGVHPNMLRYYFGSLEGLLAALVDQTVEDANSRLTGVERSIAGHPNPTAAIVQAITRAYHPEESIASIMLIEALRPGSRFMVLYEHKQRWRLFKRMERIIRRLITLGVYRSDLNSYYATFNLLSLVAGPLAIGRLERADGMSEDFGTEQWECEVIEMLRCSFCVPGGGTRPRPDDASVTAPGQDTEYHVE